jgi:hypothetical protein
MGLKMQGIIEVFDPELSSPVQIPTFTCPHCGCVGRVTSQMGRHTGVEDVYTPLFDPERGSSNDDGGWCFKCMALICRKKECGDHVEPYFQRMGFGY